MVASGFAIFSPAISGAEPWLGSYSPKLPSPRLALGSIPIDPVIILASSDNISPNIFSVSITSNCLGSFTSCIAALSTSICSKVTSGYSLATSSTTLLQSLELSRTFALSTLVTFFLFLVIAISKATFATLLISFSLYTRVSTAVFTPSISLVYLSPK